jgi:hypothetical protein
MNLRLDQRATSAHCCPPLFPSSGSHRASTQAFRHHLGMIDISIISLTSKTRSSGITLSRGCTFEYLWCLLFVLIRHGLFLSTECSLSGPRRRRRRRGLVFSWCTMAAEMRQKHAPEFHASQKPRSRAGTAKNGSKPTFSTNGDRRQCAHCAPPREGGHTNIFQKRRPARIACTMEEAHTATSHLHG